MLAGRALRLSVRVSSSVLDTTRGISASVYGTTRSFSADASGDVFNRAAKQRQREYAAAHSEYDTYNYLRDYAARGLCDKLNDIQGKKLPQCIELGAYTGSMLPYLGEVRVGVEHVFACDLSGSALERYPSVDPDGKVAISKLQVDEDWLPFARQSTDLIVSNLSLHWVNNLPQVMKQARQILKPDGLFLASVLGGDTLQELRHSLAVAEAERMGGIAPHVSPLSGVADLGNCLTNTGFSLAGVDFDTITVDYPDVHALLSDIAGMGEQYAGTTRTRTIRPDTLSAAAAFYLAHYGDKETGHIPATFQIIYFLGWAPAPTQQQPLRRGSAQRSLKDFAEQVHILEPVEGSDNDNVEYQVRLADSSDDDEKTS